LRLCIAHQIEGRTRLRALERPVDGAAFAEFAERLAACPGVDALDARHTTGSLVIEHPGMDALELNGCVAQAGGVIETATAVAPADPLQPVRNGTRRVDTALSQLTAGGLDARTLTFMVVFGMAVVQIMRGQVMVPAVSLLFYAFDLLRLPEGQSDQAPQESGD